jgi:hypothetical protein
MCPIHILHTLFWHYTTVIRLVEKKKIFDLSVHYCFKVTFRTKLSSIFYAKPGRDSPEKATLPIFLDHPLQFHYIRKHGKICYVLFHVSLHILVGIKPGIIASWMQQLAISLSNRLNFLWICCGSFEWNFLSVLLLKNI